MLTINCTNPTNLSYFYCLSGSALKQSTDLISNLAHSFFAQPFHSQIGLIAFSAYFIYEIQCNTHLSERRSPVGAIIRAIHSRLYPPPPPLPKVKPNTLQLTQNFSHPTGKVLTGKALLETLHWDPLNLVLSSLNEKDTYRLVLASKTLYNKIQELIPSLNLSIHLPRWLHKGLNPLLEVALEHAYISPSDKLFIPLKKLERGTGLLLTKVPEIVPSLLSRAQFMNLSKQCPSLFFELIAKKCDVKKEWSIANEYSFFEHAFKRQKETPLLDEVMTQWLKDLGKCHQKNLLTFIYGLLFLSDDFWENPKRTREIIGTIESMKNASQEYKAILRIRALIAISSPKQEEELLEKIQKYIKPVALKKPQKNVAS